MVGINVENVEIFEEAKREGGVSEVLENEALS